MCDNSLANVMSRLCRSVRRNGRTASEAHVGCGAAKLTTRLRETLRRGALPRDADAYEAAEVEECQIGTLIDTAQEGVPRLSFSIACLKRQMPDRHVWRRIRNSHQAIESEPLLDRKAHRVPRY